MELDLLTLNKNQALILYNLLPGPQKMKDLRKIILNYASLQKEIYRLENMRLVKTEEKIEGRRTVYVELTNDGKFAIEKILELTTGLKNKKARKKLNLWPLFPSIVESIKFKVEETPMELGENNVLLRFELKEGRTNTKERPIVDLIATKKGTKLYCKKCDSDSCYHIDALWAHPDSRKLILKYWSYQNRDLMERDCR